MRPGIVRANAMVDGKRRREVVRTFAKCTGIDLHVAQIGQAHRLAPGLPDLQKDGPGSAVVVGRVGESSLVAVQVGDTAGGGGRALPPTGSGCVVHRVGKMVDRRVVVGQNRYAWARQRCAVAGP